MDSSSPLIGGSQVASGGGLASITADDDVLEVWFPNPQLGPRASDHIGVDETDDPVRKIRTRRLATFSDLTQPPQDVPDAYLRLHALSHRLVAPGEVNLEGILDLLPTVVWSDAGPCRAADFETVRAQLRVRNRGVGPRIWGIDKFPRMVDYVSPPDIRIADADRVRLGAHLGSGTVIMHEGFVDFNAGTSGAAMVEGRIAEGALVGEGCQIGASAGVGFSLGEGCQVEAALYLAESTSIRLDDGTIATGADLAGQPRLRFYRDSLSGEVHATACATTSASVTS